MRTKIGFLIILAALLLLAPPASAATTTYVSFENQTEFKKIDLQPGDIIYITTATFPAYGSNEEVTFDPMSAIHKGGQLKITTTKIKETEEGFWECINVAYPDAKKITLHSDTAPCKYRLEIICIQAATVKVNKIKL